MQAMLYALLVGATVAIIGMPVLIAANANTTSQIASNSAKAWGEVPFQGVNMAGYYTTVAELRDSGKPAPFNYYNDSFKIFSEAGLSIVRYLFTWESYEKNPDLFIGELHKVSKSADKWGLKIVYANDQFHISSWLDTKSGYGFPSYLFSSNENRFPFGGGGSSDTEVARSWWTDWYNRKITDTNGRDGWTLQANFLKKVVSTADKHPSTLGYEILNEPQVYSEDQWTKVGSYNTFISTELRLSTNKTIIFDRQLPSDIGGVIHAMPENMAKMAPRNTSNIVFKSTLYGLPTQCSYAEARLSTAVRAAQLMNVPLWMGEFNIGITTETPSADINQTELNLFINKFREVNAWGWSMWLWSFNHHPRNEKNYDLATITRDNKTGLEVMQPTIYFNYLKKYAIFGGNLNNVSASQDESSYPIKKGVYRTTLNNRPDTICPTTVVTRVEGTRNDTGFLFYKSHLDPLQISILNVPSKLLIQGETYDVGSGLASLQIMLGGSLHTYQPDLLPMSRGSSQWSVPIDINSVGINKLIMRAADRAGNIDFTTIFLNITRGAKIS